MFLSLVPASRHPSPASAEHPYVFPRCFPVLFQPLSALLSMYCYTVSNKVIQYEKLRLSIKSRIFMTH